MIHNLVIKYVLNKNSPPMQAQSATRLDIEGAIEINNDANIALAQLAFTYSYSSADSWTMSATLSDPNISNDITLGSFLRALSPVDRPLTAIIDLVGGIVLVKANSTPSLKFDVSPEQQKQTNSKTKRNINLRATLELSSLTCAYC